MYFNAINGEADPRYFCKQSVPNLIITHKKKKIKKTQFKKDQICVLVVRVLQCTCVSHSKVHIKLIKKHFSVPDVDECSLKEKTVCDEVCTNKVGSFYCSCFTGKILENNGRTCYGKCNRRTCYGECK